MNAEISVLRIYNTSNYNPSADFFDNQIEVNQTDDKGILMLSQNASVYYDKEIVY